MRFEVEAARIGVETSMRKVLAFLAWLFSFWTWKDFFLRWFGSRSSHPASEETAEHLPSQEGQQESELARFLSSLPEGQRQCGSLKINGDQRFSIEFGYPNTFGPRHGTGVEESYREFLDAVASSKIEFREEVEICLEGEASCKRVEEFAAAVHQSSKGFRKIVFSCRYFESLVRCAKCVSSVLLENDAIQHLTLDFRACKKKMDKELAAEFMVVITQPHIIRILKSFHLHGSTLDEEGMEQLMKLFQGPPSILEHLRFSYISDAQLECLGGMLASNTSLKTLWVYTGSVLGAQACPRGYSSIGTALQSNQSLESLLCSISCSTELVSLLDPLIPKNKNDLQCNVTLTKLDLFGSIVGKEGIDALVDMIHTNTSLHTLSLIYVDDLSSHEIQGVENVLAILEALKTNKSIKRISFFGWRAIGGYEVLGTMLDLLLENPRIEDIYLDVTGLDNSGDANYVYSTLSKRKKMRLWDIVQSMAIVNPTSGRMFLCGQPMAGQTDYHSFHELVMPNLSTNGSSTMFLLMCNPMEQSNPSKRRWTSKIKSELEWWLRFIASNTRPSLSFRPHVSIVMTHFDHWKDDCAFATRIDEVVVELKSQFQKVLEFDEDKIVFKVDGRDATHARKVFDFMKSHMKALLERLPKTISACEEVQHLVALWNADTSKSPLLKWEEFCKGFCKEVEELNDVDDDLAKRKREFVAISLNDGGHIIYNEKDGSIITNPHWFCHHIIGQFLHQLCAIKNRELEMVSSNGIISLECMKSMILNLVGGEGDMEKHFDDILGMMMKLHICYKQDASSIMIPSTLKDKHESLRWSTNDASTSFQYVGRRLSCKDGMRTMLSPGFFARLQVSFFQKLQSKNVQDSYEVFQNIIKFISQDGIEVILQFHDGDIDILLRSPHCQDEMLKFLENGIIIHIKHLQEDPTLGSLGVCLIEYILRPTCVQRLVPAKDRKDQCVQVKDLEAKVVSIGVDAKHIWKSCEGLEASYDKVSSLLGDSAWKNLLERRSRDLQDYHKKIQSLGTSIPNDHSNSSHEKGGSSWTTSIWQVPQRLLYGPLVEEMVDLKRENREHHKQVMSKLDNMAHLIQNLEHGIQSMQRELLLEVCSKIDDLMAFSLDMQKSQIPKLAYLSKIGKKELLTRLVPDLDKVQLHLMCESIHGYHEVKNQEGCVVHFGTKHTKRFLMMVAWGLKIATILTKIGAHTVCGMGAMVPDLSDGVTFAALILDTPGFLDYQIPTITLESLPVDVKEHSRISMDDQFEAQRWFQEFLDSKCQNRRSFYDKFRLKKVCHTRARGSVAWLCDECISLHHNEIVEL